MIFISKNDLGKNYKWNIVSEWAYNSKVDHQREPEIAVSP